MGALIPLALTLAPQLAKWVGLDADVGEKAASLVAAVTGTEDPEDAKKVLDGMDGPTRADLQIKLAQIAADREQAERAAQVAEFQAMVDDAKSARQMGATVPMVAIAQITGFAVVLAGFVSLVAILAFRGAPTDQTGIFFTLVGILGATLATMVGFFYGNSTSAHAANQRMDKLAAQVTDTKTTLTVSAGARQ